VNPIGADYADYHVFRGGSWLAPIGDTRVAARDASYPMHLYFTLGFRLVRNGRR
jgi:hypothetical protein